MYTEENFESFKIFYQDWFDKVNSFYDNNIFEKNSIVISHETTPMGNWFYSEGKKQFGNLDQVIFLESKFIKLHNLVSYLWDAKTSGDESLAKLYYEDFVILSNRMIPNLELSKQYIMKVQNDKEIIKLN